MSFPASRFVELQGHQFHYLDFGGEGLPTAVFLHGTGFLSWLWAPYARALAGRYRVLALDQRGHGDTAKNFASFDWNHYVSDFVGFLGELKIERPFVIGHSMGAVITILAEGSHPGLLSHAVLIDPVVIGPGYYDPGFTLESDPMCVRALRRRGDWNSREEMRNSYHHRAPFVRWRSDIFDLYAQHGVEDTPDGRIRLKCPPKVEAECYLGGHFADPWPLMPRITAQMLFLRGTAGETARLARTQDAVAATPRAELVEEPHTTHFLPMENPDWVIEQINAFDARCTAGSLV